MNRRKCDFSSLKQRWEVGKAQICGFCQQHSSFSTAKIKVAVQEVEVSTKTTAEGLHRGSDPTMGHVLQEKRLESSTFLQERPLKEFWNILGPDLPSVSLEYLRVGSQERGTCTGELGKK